MKQRMLFKHFQKRTGVQIARRLFPGLRYLFHWSSPGLHSFARDWKRDVMNLSETRILIIFIILQCVAKGAACTSKTCSGHVQAADW